MKTILQTRCIQTGLLLMSAAVLSAQAGSFFSDFNTGALPPGTHTNSTGSGGAYLELTGGVGDSGCLKLTKNSNDQHGSFILDDLDSGNPIYGFDVTYKVRIGGGGSVPADGMALCVAPDLSDTSNFGETGVGSGLRFCWATYLYGNQTPPDPSLEVRGGGAGTVLTWKGYTVESLSTGGSDPSTWWADVHIRLNADGSLNLDYQGANVLTNFFIPGYQDFVNLGVPMRFGFGARTGGANDNFWIDNLAITTYTNPLVGFSQQPFSQTAQQGDDVAFDARVANTNGVTYQWYSNNVVIAGATSPTLTITNVQPAASGSKYKATATGPNNTATSTEVTLSVTNLNPPSTPQMAFNFNDGLTPAGVTLVGTAVVDGTGGGIGNSGCLKMVNPSGSAAMLVADPNPSATLYGFTARFKILVGGGTVPPADGFAFGFGTDIPDAPAGDFETGVGLGSGLRVTFDIYNNDAFFGFVQTEDTPAPSIDVRFGSQVLATVQLPISFMETGLNEDGTPAYKDCIVQLNPDATLNVVYHGALVFDHLPIPAFGSMGPSSNSTGSRFALVARTGGLNDNIWVDDFELTTVTTPGGVRISTQPVSQTILVNHSMTNTVGLNDTNGVTYQWYRGTTAISTATDSTYVLPSAAVSDSGAVFTVQATKASITVTSAPATLTVVNLTAPASPQLSFNFDNGLVPAGTGIYGNASVTANGGVGDSGCLHLTDAINGQNSAFVVSNLVFNGAQVNAISVAFEVREGGGSGNPADGFSFNWDAGLTDGVVGNAETGTGNGVSLCFRRYPGNGNADNPPSPYIGIKYKGAFIATTQIPGAQLDTDVNGSPAYRTMLFRVDADGKAYLAYGERVLYNGLQLPNYTFIANSKFGIYGRTGGENNNQWFDNVKIQATQGSGPLTVITQPANATVLAGQTATFTVALSDPNNATYQWRKNGTDISGAATSSYTTPSTTLADNGALFSVRATGPSGTVTSSNAVLTVVSPITISNPTVTYDFNDCTLPPDTILNVVGTGASGGGYIACTGGVGDSGVLHLTDAINDCHAAFIMPDPNTNAFIKAVTVYFAVRVADGSGTPADGFSFVWANDIPDNATFGQDGFGTGLTVGFDTYNNSGEAPSFNVWYHGTQLANKHVPYSALYTGDLSADPLQQYANCFIRVNANGTLDLQYKGNAIFAGLPLPGYAAMAGGRFAIGAQTGGENETHWFDNIQIATTPGLVPVPLVFSGSRTSLKLTWSGDGFKLQSKDNLNPAVQWNDVPGATSPYPLPLTGPAQYYRLVPAP